MQTLNTILDNINKRIIDLYHCEVEQIKNISIAPTISTYLNFYVVIIFCILLGDLET